MKKVLFLTIILFFIGCSSKNEKAYPSYQMQHNNAQKAWKSLDKEEK